MQFVIGNHTSYKQDIGFRPGRVTTTIFKSIQILVLFLNIKLQLILNQ